MRRYFPTPQHYIKSLPNYARENLLLHCKDLGVNYTDLPVEVMQDYDRLLSYDRHKACYR